ncbi:MAG: hypothetical protein RMK94_02615 [Armatimonadota bacterium]|nr:hypothetical protein [Armatimonadota bacterium]
MKLVTITTILLSLGYFLLSVYIEAISQENIRNISVAKYERWREYVEEKLTHELRLKSVLSAPFIYENEYFQEIVNLPLAALPYILVKFIEDRRLGRALFKITKWEYHVIRLGREPREYIWTVEEFQDINQKGGPPDWRYLWLRWWGEGKKQTPQWFVERYSKWIAAKRQGNNQLAQGMYQKLLNIGIAAIPLWLQKLEIEQDEGIKKDILNALSYLTDGEVKATMSVQDCLNWWRENKERWTIPFPKSKKAFLEWLEKEGWEEPRLTVACVITISCLEEEEAIEALLRFLRHPSPLVRAVSLKQIMKLFGEQLPKEYALGVGTDEWESYGDLVEMGKENLVRKRMMEAIGKVEDKKQAEKVADELSNWWQSKKGKVTIYWRRAWENL